MGSLMAGWDSPNLNSAEKLRKNLSLTKEEIESYWRSKKQVEEEHLRAVLSPAVESQVVTTKYKRSSSMPAPGTTDGVTDESMEILVDKHGWWTSSNLAFLNEPPVLHLGR